MISLFTDPNVLISDGIGIVEVNGGAFNVRQGNHAVNAPVDYGLRNRLPTFAQLTLDDRDVELVTGWSSRNPQTDGWLLLELSYGYGLLKRLEHRQHRFGR